MVFRIIVPFAFPENPVFKFRHINPVGVLLRGIHGIMGAGEADPDEIAFIPAAAQDIFHGTLSHPCVRMHSGIKGEIVVSVVFRIFVSLVPAFFQHIPPCQILGIVIVIPEGVVLVILQTQFVHSQHFIVGNEMLVFQRHVPAGCRIRHGNKVAFAVERRVITLFFQFREQIRELQGQGCSENIADGAGVMGVHPGHESAPCRQTHGTDRVGVFIHIAALRQSIQIGGGFRPAAVAGQSSQMLLVGGDEQNIRLHLFLYSSTICEMAR